MRTGFLVSLVSFAACGVEAVVLEQDAADQGSDLSFLTQDQAQPAEMGTDLSAMFEAMDEQADDPATMLMNEVIADMAPTPVSAEPAPEVTAAAPEVEAAAAATTEAVMEAATADIPTPPAEDATQALIEEQAQTIAVVQQENMQLVEEITAERLASDEAAAMIAEDLADTKEEIDQAKIDIASAQAAVDKASATIDGEETTATEAAAPEGEDQISTALFDLSQEELATLYAMEEEIYEEMAQEEAAPTAESGDQMAAAMAQAEQSLQALETGDLDMDMMAQWEQEMAAIEAQMLAETQQDDEYIQMDDLVADEVADAQESSALDKIDDLDAELAAEEALVDQKIPNEVGLTGMKLLCKDTSDAYIAQITDLQGSLKDTKTMTDNMANALAEIDPNMENGAEGKAFIRKMYKLRNKKPEPVTASFPQTPDRCVEMVAGKVIQIEDLADQTSAAKSFGNFFAHVYCAAYVNALVTMKDGLYQIFPGGLDQSISDELQRLYGPLDEGSAELDAIEIASVEAYFDALMTGLWIPDESSLIAVGEPMQDAMALCAANVVDDVALAQQDREDYLNDLNFLNYLKSL